MNIIDWDKSSHQQRQVLLKPVRILKKHLNMSWEEVFRDAFGARDNVGAGYEDNLRKGRIAASRAYKLFIWIQKKDAVLASNAEDEILALENAGLPEEKSFWKAMLDKGTFSNVEIYRYSNQLGMATFANEEPIDKLELKIAEKFYFVLHLPFSGQLTAFQNYGRYWFPQMLSRNGNVVNAQAGKNIIPSDQNRMPIPLWEETQSGKHGFAFLLTEKNEIPNLVYGADACEYSIPASIRNNAAKQILRAESLRWNLFRINIMFRP